MGQDGSSVNILDQRCNTQWKYFLKLQFLFNTKEETRTYKTRGLNKSVMKQFISSCMSWNIDKEIQDAREE